MCTFSGICLSWVYTLWFGCSTPTAPLPESQLSQDMPSRQIRYAFEDATWQGWVRQSLTAKQSMVLVFKTTPSLTEWTECVSRLPNNSDYILISGTIENIRLTKRYQQQVHTALVASQFNCE